ncbi:hypothetical protein ACFCX4_10915 [Kitasatospora sp. NPDC056327]
MLINPLVGIVVLAVLRIRSPATSAPTPVGRSGPGPADAVRFGARPA